MESLPVSLSLGPSVSGLVNSFGAGGVISRSLSKRQSLYDWSLTPLFPIPPDTNNVNKGVLEFASIFTNRTHKDML